MEMCSRRLGIALILEFLGGLSTWQSLKGRQSKDGPFTVFDDANILWKMSHQMYLQGMLRSSNNTGEGFGR